MASGSQDSNLVFFPPASNCSQPNRRKHPLNSSVSPPVNAGVLRSRGESGMRELWWYLGGPAGTLCITCPEAERNYVQSSGDQEEVSMSGNDKYTPGRWTRQVGRSQIPPGLPDHTTECHFACEVGTWPQGEAGSTGSGDARVKEATVFVQARGGDALASGQPRRQAQREDLRAFGAVGAAVVSSKAPDALGHRCHR